jgi:hypothetical protein
MIDMKSAARAAHNLAFAGHPDPPSFVFVRFASDMGLTASLHHQKLSFRKLNSALCPVAEP